VLRKNNKEGWFQEFPSVSKNNEEGWFQEFLSVSKK